MGVVGIAQQVSELESFKKRETRNRKEPKRMKSLSVKNQEFTPLTRIMKTQPFRLTRLTHNEIRGADDSRTLVKRSIICIALVFVMSVASSLAQTIQGGYPDFYQHQPDSVGVTVGGMCWQTAFEDAMYYDAFNNPVLTSPALYTSADNWIGGMNYNLGNIYDCSKNNNDWMNVYLNGSGFHEAAFDNNFTFDMLKQGANPSMNVLIRLAPSPNANVWWGNYHVLDVVGYIGADTIVVVHPDNDYRGGFGTGPLLLVTGTPTILMWIQQYPLSRAVAWAIRPAA